MSHSQFLEISGTKVPSFVTAQDLAAERPDSSLLHRSCPWGGHLVRLDLRNIRVMGAPEIASRWDPLGLFWWGVGFGWFGVYKNAHGENALIKSG